MVNVTSVARSSVVAEDRWSGRLVGWLVILVVANLLADMVVVAPLLALPQILQHFQTDQAAWLNVSAMLAGAMWAPLLGRSADIHGKRRILVATLAVTFVGSVVCLVAPNVIVFVLGRFLQGAAMGAVLLTVAIARQICGPRVGMIAVGIVTSGASVLGVGALFVLTPAIDEFGHQSVFVGAAVLALICGIAVRLFIPEPSIRTTGSIDVAGALLLGSGLIAVLGYVSLAPDLGWANAGLLVMLVVGAAALVGGVRHVLRVAEPIIDLRRISAPLALALGSVALGAGSVQSMLQLKSLVGEVPPELGLGYGLGGGGGDAVLMSFALAAVGILTGGSLAGLLASRIGPARTLLAGSVIGVLATFAMLVGVSVLAVGLACATLLGVAVGAIIASGFNLATSMAPPEHHGSTGSLMAVTLSIGSVTLNMVGAMVLNATATDTLIGGVPANSLTGVQLYVVMSGVALAAAAVLATVLVRRRR
ncbi:MFS transporter [Lentzea sp. E54]|uniref:MFS transporter n=1 Tax=Lentzea xerophila TaxID=3435883 RepID=UPI003DA44EEF